MVVPSDSFGLAIFFTVGLFGGAHCLGMCGPLVTLYSDRGGFDDGRASRTGIRQHLLFNLGRTLSYAMIGGMMGAIGVFVFDVAAVTAVAGPVRGVTGILVGSLIVVVGVTYIREGNAHDLVSFPFIGRRLSRITGMLVRHVDDWVQGPRIAVLGMVHGFLPCPILYPAYLYVLVQGAPLQGALSLGVLGLGTIPSLFLYGTVLETVGVRTRTRLHQGLGVAFVILGYLPLSMGLMSLGIHLPHPDIPFYQPLAGMP